MLDQLYEDVLFGGFQTPEDRSGANSPYYQPSALASSEDLTQTPESSPDAMAALASRLQGMTDARSRRNSVVSLESARPYAEGLSRTISSEAVSEDEEDLETLNKVPSYATAVRTPARPVSMYGGALGLPAYEDVERPASAGGRTSRERPRSTISELPEVLAGRLASRGYGDRIDSRAFLASQHLRCV